MLRKPVVTTDSSTPESHHFLLQRCDNWSHGPTIAVSSHTAQYHTIDWSLDQLLLHYLLQKIVQVKDVHHFHKHERYHEASFSYLCLLILSNSDYTHSTTFHSFYQLVQLFEYPLKSYREALHAHMKESMFYSNTTLYHHQQFIDKCQAFCGCNTNTHIRYSQTLTHLRSERWKRVIQNLSFRLYWHEKYPGRKSLC